MTKRPDEYKLPLRKRADIIAFIIASTNQRSYDGHPHPLCFNVKLHSGVDLDFDHLLALWRNYENDPLYTHDEGWLEAAKAKHGRVGEETLYEWGLDDARNPFFSQQRPTYGEPGTDSYAMLWNGTSIDVRYSFEGRSGGWLSINSFEGTKFTQYDSNIEDTLHEMDFSTLRKLYELVTLLKHDLQREKIKAEVELQAAFNFFANACSDIPKPDAIQRKLEFAEAT